MTQSSIPQQGHLSDNVSPDAGPYSAFQWSEVWRRIFTSDPDHGPIGLTGDTTLQVLNPSGTTFTVSTGTALVAGHFFESDATVTIPVTPPTGDSRIDKVVVVHNESISPVTHGIASGNALVFPTVLTDYGGSASIPPYSARIAILQGTPAGSPVGPALDQDPTTLHMIPLAEYQINNAGVIAGLTDTRAYTQSGGGGAVYSQAYYQNQNPFSYLGRVRLLPIYCKFAFEAGQLKNTISWISEPEPKLLGVDKYATFTFTTIDDFDIITDWGDQYRMQVFHVSGNPDYLAIDCVRGGYVNNAGNAQPPVTNATDVYGHVLLLQLLDQPPLQEGGFPLSAGQVQGTGIPAIMPPIRTRAPEPQD